MHLHSVYIQNLFLGLMCYMMLVVGLLLSTSFLFLFFLIFPSYHLDHLT